MTDEMASTPALTLPVGTQIVTRVEVMGAAGETVCPRGAVGVVIAAPGEAGTVYRVRFGP